MTYRSIKYDSLPGFSKLFLDYINGNSFFDRRFPNNKRIFTDKTFLDDIALSNKHRKVIANTISETMKDLDFSPEQTKNLNLLKSSNSLAVVTGQQVGFLGGPLYTLIKALSAIALSNKLNNHHKDFAFVPIFWIEDNDHDNLESSQITIFDQSYNPHIFNCDEFPDKNDRRVISSRVFSAYINDVIHNISDILPGTNNEELITLLNNIYKPSKSWTSAFVELIHNLTGFTGILFISASKLQSSGIFSEPVGKELENLGKTEALIHFANNQLKSASYHIQAKSSKINLFFHKKDLRYKIEPVSDHYEYFKISDEKYHYKELLNQLSQNHSAFSPNVLLRPVFQDYSLPTAAYIAGPSEIGYCSQLKEVYDFFQVSMPAFLPRHSVTLIDKKISRFLEKNDLSPEFFFCRKEVLKSFINNKFKDSNTENLIKKSIDDIQIIFDRLKALANSIDPTLDAFVDSSGTKTRQVIEAIGKKIKSAEIRKFDFLITKYNEASQHLYPFETFQERIYSPVNFLSNNLQEIFIENILDLFKKDPDSHLFIHL